MEQNVTRHTRISYSRYLHIAQGEGSAYEYYYYYYYYLYCYTISVFFFHSLNGFDYKRGKAVPDAPDTPEAARNHPNTYCTFN